MQQLQFWRREGASRSSEPDEAATPAPQQLPPPEHPGDQDGALDDVDSLMARLAEQQVCHYYIRSRGSPCRRPSYAACLCSGIYIGLSVVCLILGLMAPLDCGRILG